MSGDEEDGELSSSKLGTLEYWDQAYEKELDNFNEFGDEGEIWFGMQTVKRVIAWIRSNEQENIIRKSESRIIDIGCGNGFTCCKLADEGYQKLVGIDYSLKAIELAKSKSEAKQHNIDYQVVDIVNEEDAFVKTNRAAFDLALDKGTYDAIALCPVDPKAKRLAYKAFLSKILKSDRSFFVITSCNWTSKELIEFFTDKKQFEFIEELKSTTTSNFSFGGATGSTTSTIVFKFNSSSSDLLLLN